MFKMSNKRSKHLLIFIAHTQRIATTHSVALFLVLHPRLHQIDILAQQHSFPNATVLKIRVALNHIAIALPSFHVLVVAGIQRHILHIFVRFAVFVFKLHLELHVHFAALVALQLDELDSSFAASLFRRLLARKQRINLHHLSALNHALFGLRRSAIHSVNAAHIAFTLQRQRHAKHQGSDHKVKLFAHYTLKIVRRLHGEIIAASRARYLLHELRVEIQADADKRAVNVVLRIVGMLAHHRQQRVSVGGSAVWLRVG
mmetsp:Transcript_28824/g.45616  ORF Transcript_28824/g.45616 Transcript_28824/m.45616 type:complete len:258 (+) Transcript_28824:250-1023(+)